MSVRRCVGSHMPTALASLFCCRPLQDWGGASEALDECPPLTNRQRHGSDLDDSGELGGLITMLDSGGGRGGEGAVCSLSGLSSTSSEILQTGQVEFCSSHKSIQAMWKLWLQVSPFSVLMQPKDAKDNYSWLRKEQIVTASHSARGLVNPVPVSLSSSTGEGPVTHPYPHTDVIDQVVLAVHCPVTMQAEGLNDSIVDIQHQKSIIGKALVLINSTIFSM
ncbi:unnamed protein product [Miscanthus lutarioriparius]|uniref:Uncharacterized protein n=1 Tax=Miscanthus lutarioriparius TaxID=422564 RepID=A0A811RJL4_9POAL|nr:unnamed protein product [Miscanthus lutarioriparius]